MMISPVSGCSTPVRIFTRVDLPAPFAPTSAGTWPAQSSRSTASRARTPPKLRETPRNSTSATRAESAVEAIVSAIWNMRAGASRQVLRDKGLVECQSEAGSPRYRIATSFDLAAIGDEVPENGVALRQKTLNVGAVADAAQQVGGNLWLLVVSHSHAVGRGEPGDPPPLGRPATPRGIEVTDVDRP